MSEKIWYFARGESEHGPVTAQQIKTLATSGKLRDDDLVWREGMEDWALAGEVSELFSEPNSPTSDDSMEVTPTSALGSPLPTRPALRTSFVSGTAEKLIREIGFGCILLGVLIAMGSQGCGVAGSHYVARAEAEVIRATAKFEDEWSLKRLDLERRRSELNAQTDRDSVARQALEQTETDLSDLEERRSRAQALVEPEWQALRESARTARLNHAGWSLCRSLVFIFGGVVLTIGLVGVGVKGNGPERWVCLGMLAIVVYSLFVGGDAWIVLVPQTTQP